MHARTLSAAHGALWFSGGFTLYRRNPPLLISLTFAYLLLVIVINLIPFVGPVLLSLVFPTLTAVLGNGCHAIERRRTADVSELMRGIQSHRLSLLRLGMLNVAGSLIIIAMGNLLGLDARVDPNLDEARATELLQKLGLLMLLASPLFMAFWFAPLLTLWNGVPATKSVFFSFVASWRNWRAFAMYGVAVALFGLLAPALLLVVVGTVAGAAVGSFAFLLRLVMVFVLAPVLVASVYLSYRDVFHMPPREIDVAA